MGSGLWGQAPSQSLFSCDGVPHCEELSRQTGCSVTQDRPALLPFPVVSFPPPTTISQPICRLPKKYPDHPLFPCSFPTLWLSSLGHSHTPHISLGLALPHVFSTQQPRKAFHTASQITLHTCLKPTRGFQHTRDKIILLPVTHRALHQHTVTSLPFPAQGPGSLGLSLGCSATRCPHQHPPLFLRTLAGCCLLGKPDSHLPRPSCPHLHNLCSDLSI